MSLQFITDFHTAVRNNPKHYGKKIHTVCAMVEKLLKDKRIEYCESDVNAFMDMAKMFKHWKGTTKRIELDMVQKWIVACVLGIKIQDKDGDWVRYFKECRIFVAKKFGKALALNTPILTTDGWKTIGTVNIGDCVFSEKGLPTKVINKSEVFTDHKCYDVYFDDGEVIKADADHLWNVTTASNRRVASHILKGNRKLLRPDLHKTNGYETKTTEQLAKDFLTKTSNGDTFARYSVPMAKPIEYTKKNLPIEPYFLGCWMGDGLSKGNLITVGKEDIDEVEKIFTNKGITFTKRNDSGSNHLLTFGEKYSDGFSKNKNTIKEQLKNCNLLFNKHIPETYFTASIEQRRELLQGLMDTDGYCAKKGLCEFTQKRENIVNDFCRLLNTLGIKYHKKSKTAKCNGVDAGIVYTVSFYVSKENTCFKLKRKTDKLKTVLSVRAYKKSIINIQECETVPTQCISVDNPTKLFCVGERNTVTHNSVLMALFAMWGLLFDKHREGAEVYCIATKKEQAKIVLENVRVYRKQNPQITKICKEVYESGDKYIFCDDNNGVIKALSSSKNGLQGKNPSWVMFDEAQEVKDFEVIEAVRTGMATRKQPMFVSMSTAGVTPDSAYHQMYSQIEVMCEQKKFDDKARVFFAVFEIDITDSIDDKACWIKANPSLLDGRPTLEHLEREYALAKIGDGDKSLPKFIAFHLNRSCDGAQTYFDTAKLKACTIDITEEMIRDCYGYGGSDLAEFTDLCCSTTLIPYQHANDENVFDFIVLQRYFAAEKRIQKKSETDKVIYNNFLHTKSKFAESIELLHLCSGDIVDFNTVAMDYKYLADNYEILYRKIGYDKWKSGQFLLSMSELGFTEEKRIHSSDGSLTMRDDGVMTEVRQGKFLSEMIKLLKVLIDNGRLKFDKTNALLAMCCANAKVSSDKDNLLQVEKQKSTGRIDGLLSLLCALMAFTCDKENFIKNILPYSDCNKLK